MTPFTAQDPASFFNRGLIIADAATEPDQLRAQREASLDAPEAARQRDESQTAYADMNAAASRALASRVFPGLVHQADGGVPALPAGVRITGFDGAHAARVSLPNNRVGVLESVGQIATESTRGVWRPLDLAPERGGGGYGPVRSDVPARLPANLGEGVSLPAIGVSLTPLAASGTAPASAATGTPDGYAVVWSGASMGAGVDLLGRLTPTGADLLAMLRSQASPETLRFRLGMPAGASALAAAHGNRVRVVAGRRTIAEVAAPRARDAQGTVVPLTMALSGDVMTLKVRHPAGRYAYPLMVDPTVTDTATALKLHGGNWWFYASPVEHESEAAFSNLKEGTFSLDDHNAGWSYKEGQYGLFGYETQGESRIYEFTASTVNNFDSPTISSVIYIGSGAGTEAGPTSTVEAGGNNTVCVASGCAAEIGTSKNWANGAFYKQSALKPGSARFENELKEASVYIVQEKGPSASFDTNTAQVLESGVWLGNGLYGGHWASVNGHGWGLSLNSSDPGIGVHEYSFSSPQVVGWGRHSSPNWLNCLGVQCAKCAGHECPSGGSNVTEWIGENLYGLPEGEDTVKATVKDDTGLSATTEGVVKVDDAPPYNITLTGLPETVEAGDHQYKFKLKASATDGSGSTPSSGIASIAFTIDGRPIGTPSGKCQPGPCTATSNEVEWTFNGWEYPAGPNTFRVVATDGAGNVETYSRTLSVRHASTVVLKPGSLDPVSGEFALSATDVSLGDGGVGMSVGRSYRSRHLTAGETGPLGPQWSLSLDEQPVLVRLADGSMVMTTPGGGKTIFQSNGAGGFVSPPGNSNVVLSSVPETSNYKLEDTHTKSSTTFTMPAGEYWHGEGTLYAPTVTESSVVTGTVKYTYQMVEAPKGSGKQLLRPQEVLAPSPEGVVCSTKVEESPSTELKRGCRALTFNYASATTAKGEAPEEWGDHEGYLTRVYFTAWSNSSNAMKTVEVAHYLYDAKGRLRAVWDPRVSPALKSAYGYDAEGHVTSVSPPGQEPWLFTYGTDATDGAPGRLLSVVRPNASTALGSGAAPSDTAAPTLSTGTPAVGSKISVSSNGSWNNMPLYYSYQWEDCNASGGGCVPIAGAVNASYYPATSDEGHTLVAQVTATNADGAAVVSTAATGPVAGGTPNNPAPEPPNVGTNAVQTVDYGVAASGSGAPYNLSAAEAEKWAQKDDPVEGTAIFPPDEPMGWPAKDYRKATVLYVDSKERSVNIASSSGGIATTEYNETNDVARSLSADNRAEALKAGAKSAETAKALDTESSYESEGTELLSTLGPRHMIKLANGKEKQARGDTSYGYDQEAPSGGGPYRLVTSMTEQAYSETEGELEGRETLYSYTGQEDLGWTLRKPTSVTIDPKGMGYIHAAAYNATTGQVTETSPPGAFPGPTTLLQFGSAGSGGKSEFSQPKGIALDSKGHVWVADSNNNRIQEFTASTGKLVRKFGTVGTGNGQFKYPQGVAIDSHGNVWVTDAGNNRVEEFNEKGEYLSQFGVVGTGPGQLKDPEGIAIDSAGNLWIGDMLNNRVQEFSSEGKPLLQFGSPGSGNGQFKTSTGLSMWLSIDSSGHVWVGDKGNGRIQEFSATGEYMKQVAIGKVDDFAFDASGNLWIAAGSLVQMTQSGTVLQTFGRGVLNTPFGLAIDSSGNVWITEEEGGEVRELAPSNPSPDSTATQTIYYTAGANSIYPECGERPEWTYLTCRTQPTKQPNTSGVPNLPDTTVTYNMYDEPEKTTSTVGGETRTTTVSYDEAGRPIGSSVTSTVGTALPAVSEKYSTSTGFLVEQSTTSEGKTQSLISKFNALGQVTEYTDADGNVSSFEYETEKDMRLTHVNDGKGTQTDSYNETTGALDKIVDSAAGTFTATYDLEGNIESQTYPNAMTEYYTRNPAGKLTGLEYVKTAHCASTCPEVWYSDKAVPSIYGQWMSQTSTLSAEKYTYDSLGRLTQVEATPAGKGCVNRIYAYDQETNRVSLTTRQPNTEGKCTSTGGTVESDTYDLANRLLDTGTSYDPFGNTTALPSGDAGGSELTSSFYDDNQLASQTQNGETIGYQLDPAGRTRETVSTGKATATEINHYANAGPNPAWSVQTSGQWNRNVWGFEGLEAIQRNGAAPVLQLSNLHGDVVATASDSETATALASTISEASEYGVPATEAPPKFSWLGSHELPTMLPSGVVAMGARSYVPQLGRFLQTDPIAGGSVNAYAYVFGDPVNAYDLSGEYGGPSGWAIELATQISNEEVIALRRAEEEAAARAEAEREAEEAWLHSGSGWGYPGEGGGPGEEWEEEEWEEEGEEYAAYHAGSNNGQEVAGLTEGLSWRPFGEEASSETGTAAVPLCRQSYGPCAHYVAHRGKKSKKSSKPQYNICTGHPNPNDRAEQCCVSGKVVPAYERSPVGMPCDGEQPGPGDPPARPGSPSKDTCNINIFNNCDATGAEAEDAAGE